MSEMIEVQNLTRKFGTLTAVDQISFQVGAGELFGFLGVNGAGKSTTINMMSTIYAPTSGTIRICGHDTVREADEVRHKIGVVGQSNSLDSKLTVRENLMVRGALYEKSNKKIAGRLKEVSDILELNDVIDRRYGMLSGGQKRRCEVAKALMNTPELLFLDEPTTGLDPATRKSLWSSLTRLRKETSMTIFLTTHYMEEAAKASHIAIIEQGRILEYGTPFELKEKYAKDKIFIIPSDMTKVTETLDHMNIPYKNKENKLSLTIESTLQALPILNTLQDDMSGFEVIQGSMDDVFLNVTGKSLEESKQEPVEEKSSGKKKHTTKRGNK